MQTKTLIVAGLAAFSLCGTLHAQNKPQDKMTTPHSFSRKVSKKIGADYLLYLPKGFESGKNWPLILFLHGAGERGTDVWRANIHGPIKYAVEHTNDFPFVLVTPLCPTDETWSTEMLVQLLDEAIQKYKIDAQRVYLTGLSMGGFGTWTLAAAHPERFAAVAPICGGGDVLPFLLAAKGFSSPARKEQLKSLSIWAFHGGKDTVVPISESERMIAAVKELGIREIEFTVYPEAQHDSWSATYANPKLYQWFLGHTRAK